MSGPTTDDGPVRIVHLTEAEGPRLRRLRLQALADSPEAFGSTLAESRTRPPESWVQQLRDLHTLFAVRGDHDVGMVRGTADPHDASVAWLISMWVAPSARRHGVGHALVMAVIAWARDRGFQRLLLDVGDHNEKARALYVRCGFTPTGITGALPPPRDHLPEHQLALSL